MTEQTIHLIRPGGLPPVFSLSDYNDSSLTACQIGTRRRVGKKAMATHDPTLVTCEPCIKSQENRTA